MSGQFDEGILDIIRSRVDIVRLIGEYVPSLKRAGRSYKGLCPFHSEKTPSFFVNPDKQIFKCFGCGESGNVFSFLMKQDGLTFHQAVERLARTAGVILPDPDPDAGKRRTHIDLLRQVMMAASTAFLQALEHDSMGVPARKYLENRGFTASDFHSYGLGFAPKSWDFLQTHPAMKSFHPADMEEAGLTVKNQSGSGYHDRMRDRITFAIREHREGLIVAFGGRALGDDPAKYLNTSETPIYTKSRILYGLREALPGIRAMTPKSVIIVEGYFDRLSLAKAGISNVVASCGTSLTQEHIQMLKQSTENVYLMFDADSAGISAAKRGLYTCLTNGMDAIAVPLPRGLDPDDTVRKLGKQGILDLLDKGLPAIDFLIQAARSHHDLKTVKGKTGIVEEMLPFLLDVENPIHRGSYVSKIADLIQVPEPFIIEIMRKSARSHRSVQTPQQDGQVVKLDAREENLLLFWMHHPEFIDVEQQSVRRDHFLTENGRRLMDELISMKLETDLIDVSKLLDRIGDLALKKIVTDLMVDPNMQSRIMNKSLKDSYILLVNDLILHEYRTEIQRIRLETRRMQSEGGDVTEHLAKQMEYARKIDEIRKMSAQYDPDN